jgi:hypothetical protein
MVQSARKDTVFADEARHIAEEAVARPTALHTTGPGAHHFVLAQLRRNVLKEEVAVGPVPAWRLASARRKARFAAP